MTQTLTNTRIVVDHYGGPDELRVVEEERREPKPGEVRVRVLAAGVSLPDVMMREGIHPETPSLPFTPGWDLVGAVDEVGDGVTGIEPGQLVAALPISGAYAEYVCLPQRELVPVPPELDAAEAVSLVLNYTTAYQMLHRCARVNEACSCCSSSLNNVCVCVTHAATPVSSIRNLTGSVLMNKPIAP